MYDISHDRSHDSLRDKIFFVNIRISKQFFPYFSHDHRHTFMYTKILPKKGKTDVNIPMKLCQYYAMLYSFISKKTFQNKFYIEMKYSCSIVYVVVE